MGSESRSGGDALLPRSLDALTPFEDLIGVAMETQEVLTFRFTASRTDAQTEVKRDTLMSRAHSLARV